MHVCVVMNDAPSLVYGPYAIAGGTCISRYAQGPFLCTHVYPRINFSGIFRYATPPVSLYVTCVGKRSTYPSIV